MACFLTPAAVAVITTSLRKKIAPKYHLEWLNLMLWGGVTMLMIDHIANGEIVSYPPFLTAVQNLADIPAMLREMVTTGTAMTVATVLVWAVMVLIANNVAKMREKKIQITAT